MRTLILKLSLLFLIVTFSGLYIQLYSQALPSYITTTAAGAGVTATDWNGYITTGKKAGTYYTCPGQTNPPPRQYPTTPMPDLADIGQGGLNGATRTIPVSPGTSWSGLTYYYTVTPTTCRSYYVLDMSTINSSTTPAVGVSLYKEIPNNTNPYTSTGTTMTTSPTGVGTNVLTFTGTTKTSYYNTSGTQTIGTSVATKVIITATGAGNWLSDGGNLRYLVITGSFTINVLAQTHAADWVNHICTSNTQQLGCPYESCNTITCSPGASDWYGINYWGSSIGGLNNNYVLNGTWGSGYISYEPKWLQEAPPTMGSLSNAGPINFCNSSGDWTSSGISVTGQNGTVNWQYGWSSGGWSGAWVSGASPGFCCFPKKTASSDGNADRVRYYVSPTLTCPATNYSSAILLQNRYNEAPSSLSASSNTVCQGTSVTLTANFPSAIDILGSVEFFSGSCGGTLIATVTADNNVSSVSTIVTPPVGTTTYYARYNPGTGSGCSPTACASTSVTVHATSNAGTIAQTPASGSTVCNGSSVNYQANGITGTFNYFEYQWNTTSGSYSGSWATSNPYNWTASLNGASILYVRAVVTNGVCPTAVSAPVNITVLSTDNNPGAVSASNICVGSSASITNVTAATTGTPSSAGPTYYYYWSRTSSPATSYTNYASSSASSYALPTEVTGTPGTYLLARNSQFACTSQANNVTTVDIPMTVYANPGTATVGATQNICASFTSGALGGNAIAIGTATWTKYSGPGNASFSNANSGSSTATVDAWGTYVFRWTFPNNGSCPGSYADVTVNYYQTPTSASISSSPLNNCGTLTSGSLGGNHANVGIGTWSYVSGPGTYSFSAVNSESSTVTVSTWGTYVFQWTISNGTCSPTTAQVTVNFYQTPTTATVGGTQNICGSLTCAALGGNLPSAGTGAWSKVSGPGTVSFSLPANGSSTATASLYGTYVLRWTISNGSCTPSTADVTVNYYATPTTATISPSTLYLCGALTSVPLGGNAPSIGTGAWSQFSGPGTTSYSDQASPISTATFSLYGTYVLKWTISNGTCTPSVASVTLYAPVAVAVTVNSSSNPLCYGSNDGSVTLNAATGGSGTYMYAKRLPGGSGTWSSWQSSTTFNGLVDGSYGFKAKDINGCESAEVSRVLTQPGDMNATRTPTDPTCYGGSDGSVVVNASGGTPPYQFSIDGGVNYVSGSNPHTFTNLSVTSYFIAVRDAHQCVFGPVYFSLNPRSDITISSVTPTIANCYNGSDGTITVVAEGGTGGLVYSKNNGSSYQTSNVFTGLAAGTYNIMLKDGNGCTKPYGANPVTVSQNGQLNATVNSTNVTCNGYNDGTITFSSPSGGHGLGYEYSINATDFYVSPVFTGIAPGTYNVVIRDEDNPSCPRSLGYKVITQPDVAAGGAVTDGNNPICFGYPTGLMTVRGQNGPVIRWEKNLNGGLWSSIINTGTSYSEIPSSIGTWHYRAVIENVPGCATANSAEDEIIVYAPIHVDAGTDASVTGRWTYMLNGNVPADGIGTWTKISGPGTVVFSDIHANNATVTINDYGSYTFRWTIVFNCTDYDNVNVAFSPDCSGTSTFTGTGNWNDHTHWDDGVPTACVNATINGDVTVTENAACYKLIVNGGKSVTVNSAFSLAVVDSLKLKANANGNAAMIDKGSLTYNSSKCEVLLYVAGSNARDTLYHMYSSPVLTPSVNVFWYFWMYHFDEPNGYWAKNYTYENMVNGLGYAGYYTGNISLNPSVTIKYHGYPMNTGTYNFGLSNSGDDPSHFNLVGNPYPSPVNLDSLTFSGTDDNVFFWNSSGTWRGQYGTYNILTHLATKDGGNILPEHQAIFVSATGSSPSVRFTNNARVKSSHPFYKSYNTLPDHLQLVVNANDYNDAIIVGFTDNATPGFDGKYDARKLFGGYDMIPSLYAKTNDGVNVTVNELPLIHSGDNVIVPVEFTMGMNGDFTLKAEDINTFDSGMSIYLEDKTAHNMINLRVDNTYVFNYVSGENPDRFNLHFRMAANGIDENSSSVNIYSYSKSIYINSDNSLTGILSVYNVLGQEMISRQLDGKTIYSVNMNGASKGYYLVKIITEHNTITRKVYID